MDENPEPTELARRLTAAFWWTPWREDLLVEAGAASLDQWPSWLAVLAMRLTTLHPSRPDVRYDLFILISDFLSEHLGSGDQTTPAHSPAARRVRAAVPRHLREGLLEIRSLPDLAARLELSDGQLAWLADVRSLERTVTSERLRNYRYRALPRDSGIPRVIESPKARLKEIQRWVLREVLDHVPPHPAAHGFTRARSAVTHAAEHTGRAAVLRLDLKDFFASVPAARIYRIWRTLGYPRAISHILTGLTTNTVPLAAWEEIALTTPAHAVQPRFDLGRQLATPHLPQGAPTSPALANLAAFGLDRRLAGLARSSGLTYSRYADDLTFSGPARLIRRRAEFEAAAATIVRAEGFTLNPAKTTTHSAGGRQTVCGVVVNVHPNIRRSEYDRLKATLHNAALHGPTSQNRDSVPDFRAHLRGRIAWVESLNPSRGRRLRALFDRIDWSPPPLS